MAANQFVSHSCCLLPYVSVWLGVIHTVNAIYCIWRCTVSLACKKVKHFSRHFVFSYA
jgi:hypothetical protein